MAGGAAPAAATSAPTSGAAPFERPPADVLVRAVAAEINRLRRNPAGYAEELLNLEACYSGTLLTYPESGLEIETSEGVAALHDCIQDLLASSSLPALTVSQAVCRACELHLADLQEGDLCSHLGRDGSTPEERLARFGDHKEQCGENIVFGAPTAREAVIQMLLDDGSPDRGHRANLLNMDFHFMGIAFGPHPSEDVALVLLFVDTFKCKQASATDRMRNVAETFAGEVQEALGESRDDATHKAWDRLVHEMKPDYLQPPKRLHEQVHRAARPRLYGAGKRHTPPRHLVGDLQPKPAIDPAVVKAFIHRLDGNNDDCLEESEVGRLCHQLRLNIGEPQVRAMFDEVLARRPWQDRPRRALDGAEVYAALRAERRWAPALDVHIKRGDGSVYELTMEVDHLERGCRELCAALGPEAEGLLPPMPSSPASPSASRAGGGGVSAKSQGKPDKETRKQLNSFLAVAVRAAGGGADVATEIDSEAHVAVQTQLLRLLGRPGEDPEVAGPVVVQAKCMSLRRLWAYKVRPFSEAWLGLVRGAGLEPVPPAAARPTERPAANAIAPDVAKRPSNVARAGPAVAGTGRARVMEPRESVRVRPDDGASTRRQPAPEYLHPWEERQQQTELLVNQGLAGADASDAASGTSERAMASSVTAGPSFTFAARRRFQQVLSKQQRASDEQRAVAGTASRRGGPSASASAPAASRVRGAGAFPLTATGGVRGHFHSAASVITGAAATSSHVWPQSLDVGWDGAHIDHTKAPPLKADPRFSTMSKVEKEAQFSTYFGKAVRDNFDLKRAKVVDQIGDIERYTAWRKPEFRADAPDRHGKFGRRVFDPMVREKPVDNPHGIGEIETKPMETFFRQQERVHDFLDRTLPPGQRRQFKQHLPECERPGKYVDFVGRQPVLGAISDGAMKRCELGFGQNRHSGPTDMKLYSRPLGASQLDRCVPLA